MEWTPHLTSLSLSSDIHWCHRKFLQVQLQQWPSEQRDFHKYPFIGSPQTFSEISFSRWVTEVQDHQWTCARYQRDAESDLTPVLKTKVSSQNPKWMHTAGTDLCWSRMNPCRAMGANSRDVEESHWTTLWDTPLWFWGQGRVNWCPSGLACSFLSTLFTGGTAPHSVASLYAIGFD